MQTRNLLSEQLILLTELPELLPKKRGKKVHPSLQSYRPIFPESSPESGWLSVKTSKGYLQRG